MSDPISPTDEEFAKAGLTDHQISLLKGWPNEVRQEVYDEQMRLLMERPSGYDTLNEDLNL